MLKFFKNFSKKFKESTSKICRLVFPEKIDESGIKTVENILYSADFGVDVTTDIINELCDALKKNKELRREHIVSVASEILRKTLLGSEGNCQLTDDSSPDKNLRVICLVGSNGSGKTTTAAKLAYFYKNSGRNVMLCACDTFRAAASEQLTMWANRLSIDIISSQHGADPAAVAFDAHRAAIAREKNILILDTAGRLHVKSNLMAELQKIIRTLKKSDPDLKPHVWMVADGTIGTNTITSTKTFHEAVGLTGMIITKLDGTSSGGALVGVYKTLKIPIYFIGTGEQASDLETFSVEKYVSEIFQN